MDSFTWRDVTEQVAFLGGTVSLSQTLLIITWLVRSYYIHTDFLLPAQTLMPRTPEANQREGLFVCHPSITLSTTPLVHEVSWD